GPSGLAMTKELLEQGHRPVCFEQAPGLGGVFRYDERRGSVWPTCRLTSSGLITAFSDFPVTGRRAAHMTVGEYVEYLSEYSRAFGVDQVLRFGVTVEAVDSRPAGGWDVTYSSEAGRSTERFDAVAVCSGVHQVPCVPDVPGLADFPGTVLHSSAFRGRPQVEGKRVLIVGAGESGADIVAVTAEGAAQTVLSLRRGVAVVPRMAFGRPRDYLTTRLLNSPADWIHQTRHPDDDHKRAVYRRAFLPAVIVDKVLQIVFRQFWVKFPLLLSARREHGRIKLKAQGLIRQLLRESGGTMQEQFGTKDDAFVFALARGTCTRAPA
ncbi:MAG: SidA/IucD/PvdA family monooxygenase, partial [Elusimicrobiales bacterium]|nr:SidA/IucD/PvdA family monooxygenase [Elusimicrobiales bacterium]